MSSLPDYPDSPQNEGSDQVALNATEPTRDSTPTMQQIKAQDRAISFARFGHEDAWALGAKLLAIATHRGLPIAAAIWLGEQRVFHVGRPGTTADNDGWLERKRGVVLRYDAPSMQVALRWREVGIRLPEPFLGLDPSKHALAGGAFPIRILGTTVGVVAVSGLSEEDDHAVAVEALSLLAAEHRS